MRDPKRIPDVLEALRVYWEANPDLRLGQIIGNTAGRTGHGDGYNMEDDVLVAGLGA